MFSASCYYLQPPAESVCECVRVCMSVCVWNFLICPRSNCDGNWFRFLLPSAPRAQHAPLLSTLHTPTSLPYFPPPSALLCASTTMANYSNNSCHYYYSSSSFCCCCVLCFAICRKISLPLLLSAFNNKFFAWQKKQKHEEVGEKARGKRQRKWERE